MENAATNLQTVTVSHDQHYEWGIVENRFGKTKKYACIDYYFQGEIWKRIVDAMRRGRLKSMAILYYKGGIIDEPNKTVKIRGSFIRDVVADKYFPFWNYFLNGTKTHPPKFIVVGDHVKLPSIAGDNDSLNIFVNGQNVNDVLVNGEE